MLRWVLCYLLFLLSCDWALAYPAFISYGYSSCITCHYNGHGGGALNDYGRALFASEITARDIFSANIEEDEIAAGSGFLGKTELPWWVRPGAKYRGLWFQNSPGSETAKTERFFNMQADINLNFFFDKKQKYALITTAGYSTYPRRFSGSTELKTPFWFAKEYYVRYQINKTFWLYVGQLERVFGLRQIDHTAVSRQLIGMTQFNQSQGFVLHWIYPTWDFAVNAFFGNGDELPEFKQKGVSVSGEYEIFEKFKVGGSALVSKNETLGWKNLAIHSRIAVGKGTSLQTEFGLFEKTSLGSVSATPVTGTYGIIENWMSLRRGYNILSQIQYAKSDIKTADAERSSFGFGALMYPLPKTEIRMMAINGKTYNEQSATQDSWQLQSQLHLSW